MPWIDTLNRHASGAIEAGNYPLARSLIVVGKRVVTQEILPETAERQMRRLMKGSKLNGFHVPYDPRQLTHDLILSIEGGIQSTGATSWDGKLVRYVGEHFGWGLPDNVRTEHIQIPKKDNSGALDERNREDQWLLDLALLMNTDLKSTFVQTVRGLAKAGFNTVGMIRNEAVRDVRGLVTTRASNPARAQMIAGILMERY